MQDSILCLPANLTCCKIRAMAYVAVRSKAGIDHALGVLQQVLMAVVDVERAVQSLTPLSVDSVSHALTPASYTSVSRLRLV